MSSEFSYKQNVISNTFENGIRTNYFKYTFISWWMLTSFPLYRSIFLLVMSNTCLSTLSSVQFIIKHLDLYQYVVKKKKSQCSFNLHFFEWGWTAFHILKICFHEHRWYSFPITRISDFCDSFSFYDSFLVFVYIYICKSMIHPIHSNWKCDLWIHFSPDGYLVVLAPLSEPSMSSNLKSYLYYVLKFLYI